MAKTLAALFLTAFLVCAGAPASAQPGASPAPYQLLRDAFAARSSSQAASAHSETATLIDRRHSGASRSSGRAAIREHYESLFSRDAGPLDLNFRITGSAPMAAGSRDSGFIRLRPAGDARAQPTYGRFTATLARAPDGALFISSFVVNTANETDFEEAAGPVLFAPDDEELAPYYNRFLGRYRRPDNCQITITRSVRRLWARDSCSLEWRGLTRVSGTEWTAGSAVISAEVVSRYRFEGAGITPRRLSISPSAAGGPPPSSARRIEPYRIEQITFRSADGVSLAGQLWIPTAGNRRAGIVLAHGSGPQDRHGYASILAVLADALAERGYTVLTYDKRGVGGSDGDWARASFAVLGDDLAAGLAALQSRTDLVDPNRVGIGGSSQAGWISAKAIERGAAPSFVFLVGAAGSAMPVTVQNRFNVGVTLRCAGFSEAEIATVLDQNDAFYAFRRDPRTAATLDARTAGAARNPRLADWLLPDSSHFDTSGGAWYSVMEIDFDPVPVWRAFPGRLIFVQGDQDDQTPVAAVRERLVGLSSQRLSLHILDGAQHLGLRADEVCAGARLEALASFHPGLFQAIGQLD